MNIYIILRYYSNNVSVVDGVYSSKKKAEKELDWHEEMAYKDGWGVVKEGIRIYQGGKMYNGVQFVPPSGNLEHADTYIIVKQEVK